MNEAQNAASVAKVGATVMEHVRAVAQECAKNLTIDTNVVDLGLDSLERLDIIGRVEGAFSVRIPEEELLEIETCREITQAVLKQQSSKRPRDEDIPPGYYQFEKSSEYLELKRALDSAATAGERDPFYAVHESISTNKTRLGGRELINFSSNNYVGMSGDPDVMAAAKEAVDLYGTSNSASRLVSGTRRLHVELEREIADLIGAPEAITFLSGFQTNATVIGHLMGQGDLIVHDELSHNSLIMGARLSGATRRPFPHNDWEAADRILKEIRRQYRKALVVIEGVYSMDGDYADVPRFIEVKKRHKAMLMLDEAHAIGTMGKSGRGMSEFFGLKTEDIDIWMATLSKGLGASGGYIAGQKPLVQYIKYTCPGVVFSGGLSPPVAGAALASIRKLRKSPERVAALQARARQFLALAKERGMNTGPSQGTAIIPVMLGNSLHSLQASRMMRERGISVQPILHPAVAEEGARLRFFLSALHTEEQIATTVDTLVEVLRQLDPRYLQHGR